MSDHPTGRARRRMQRPRRIGRGLRETGIVLGLIALALASVWLIVRSSIRTSDPGGPPGQTARSPDSLLPDPIPYADLIQGTVRVLADNRVEVVYDFEPIPKIEGRVFAEADLIPQLEDWNEKLSGTRARGTIIRQEWRLRGEARTRLAFVGPVEVEVDLELASGSAAIQVVTNRAGEGYECVIGGDGTAVFRMRPRGKEREGREEPPAPEPVVLGTPVTLTPSPRGRLVRLTVSRTADSLRLRIAGEEVLSAPLPETDPFPTGNVALRTTGRSYWDNVTITGTLDPAWLEDRLYMAVSLIGKDHFEKDDTWTTARELLPGGEIHSRSFCPEGDTDWVAIPAPHGARAVQVTVTEIRLGVSVVLETYEADGRTPIEGANLQARSPGGGTMRVPLDGRTSVYVKISEPENRRGTYAIAASPVRQP